MIRSALNDLPIGHIASRSVLTLQARDSLSHAIDVFSAHQASCLVVLEQNQPVGIITERDLLRLACSGYDHTRPVRAVMSTPLVSARQDMDFATAQTLMSKRGVRHLVLIDAQGELFGVVTETDFRRHVSHDLFDAIQHLGIVMEAAGELIPPDTPLEHVLELMAARRLDHVVLGTQGIAQGIITERDVPRWLAAGLDITQHRAAQVMSQPLRTLQLHTPVAEAARILTETRLRHLVVQDAQGHFVGVLSQHRMLERLSAALLEENHQHLTRQAHANRQRFLDFVERLPLPLCHVGPDGGVLYLNHRFSRVLGYTLDDLPHQTAWWMRAFPDPGHRQQVQNAWQSALDAARDSGEPIEPRVCHIRTRQGEERIMEVGGVVLGAEWLMTLQDVSETYRAHAQLQEQLDELQRWQAVMLDREDRVLALKQEVNALLARLGEAPRYASPETPSENA